MAKLRSWYSRRANRAALATNSAIGPERRSAARRSARRGAWRRWILFGIAAAAALVLIVYAERELLPTLAAWFGSLGASAPAAFIVVYVLLTVALVPNSFLTIASGALFGLFWGTVYSFAASVLGAVGAFLMARYVVRDRMARRIVADPRFQRVDRAICRKGLRVMLLIRLSPVFPFSLLNYALGLSRVRLRDYIAGSISMLPGTALYVYPGMVAGQVVALGAGRAQPRETGYYLMLAVGLVVTILAVVLLTRVARRALREETEAPLTRM